LYGYKHVRRTHEQVQAADELLVSAQLAADAADKTSERRVIITKANALLSEVCKALTSPLLRPSPACAPCATSSGSADQQWISSGPAHPCWTVSRADAFNSCGQGTRVRALTACACGATGAQLDQVRKQLMAARDDSDFDGSKECTTGEEAPAGVMSVRKFARACLNHFASSYPILLSRILQSPSSTNPTAAATTTTTIRDSLSVVIRAHPMRSRSPLAQEVERSSCRLTLVLLQRSTSDCGDSMEG
jgi:hypothetical protein